MANSSLKQIGAYQIHDTLMQGSTGIVLLAKHNKTGKFYACKKNSSE